MAIIFLALFCMSLISSNKVVFARYKEGKMVAYASISFKGYEEVPTGYEFKYLVKSGIGKNRIRFWSLESDAFSYYPVITSSEKFVQKTGTLRFSKSYKNAEVRRVEFTLKKAYSEPKLDLIRYVMKLQWFKPGVIKGPLMPNE